MARLYEITEKFKGLEKLSESETDADMQQAIVDTMEAIEGEFKDKAIAVAQVAENLRVDAEAIGKSIKHQQARKKVIENKAERLKEYLRKNMEAARVKKIDDPLLTITNAMGKEIVVIDNESLIPEEFMSVSTEIKPNKDEIKKAYKDGAEEKITIPGAHIERAPSSIRIR